MAEVLALVVVTLFLAYANGANDNFKGVATLFGSRTTNYRRALWWATGTTLLGSCAAVLLSGGLVRAFSGKGLVPETLTNEPWAGLHSQPGYRISGCGCLTLGNPRLHHSCLMRKPVRPWVGDAPGKMANHPGDPGFLVDHPTLGRYFRGDGLLVVSVTKNRLRGESPECEMEFLDRTVCRGG